MLKKCFVAAAIMLSIPAFASAQDIFWSFSPTEVITTSNPSSTTGSVYIFSDGLFGFDAIDLDFTTSNSDVLRFTGGEAFDPEYNTIGGTKFNRSVILFDNAEDENSGRLFSVNVTQNGVNPDILALFDPNFVADAGPNGAVLLARVDYELIGFGDANLEFALGPLGIFELPNNYPEPSFGSATVSMGMDSPEFPIGDVNLSGTADVFDIIPFLVVLITSDYQREADCNFDGVVGLRDIPPFVTILTSN